MAFRLLYSIFSFAPPAGRVWLCQHKIYHQLKSHNDGPCFQTIYFYDFVQTHKIGYCISLLVGMLCKGIRQGICQRINMKYNTNFQTLVSFTRLSIMYLVVNGLYVIISYLDATSTGVITFDYML